MSAFTEYFISGSSYITGFLLIIIATLASFFEVKLEKKKLRYPRYIIRFLFILGVLLLLFSGTPISGFYLRFFGIVIIGLMVALHFESETTRGFAFALRVIVIGVAFYALRNELRYRALPTLPDNTYEDVYVIGDSLSAGIGFKGEKTWVDILKTNKKLNVITFTVGGAKLEYAAEMGPLVYSRDCLVILEIGGNDVLAGTPPDEFAEQLEKLLVSVSGKNRHVVMFELPLPPFSGHYGYIQRRLAGKYHVLLIPRRVLSELFTAPYTQDGLHLSNEGHKKLAETIFTIFPRLRQ